jgi:hypothetical protein
MRAKLVKGFFERAEAPKRFLTRGVGWPTKGDELLDARGDVKVDFLIHVGRRARTRRQHEAKDAAHLWTKHEVTDPR